MGNHRASCARLAKGAFPTDVGPIYYLAAPASTKRLHILALAHLERRLASTSTSLDRRCAKAILDLLCHCKEGLLDIGRVLGAGLEERNVELLRKLLGSLVVNSLATREIGLVTNQQLVDAFARVTLNLLEPLLDVLECGWLVSTYPHL